MISDFQRFILCPGKQYERYPYIKYECIQTLRMCSITNIVIAYDYGTVRMISGTNDLWVNYTCYEWSMLRTINGTNDLMRFPYSV